MLITGGKEVEKFKLESQYIGAYCHPVTMEIADSNSAGSA